MAQWRSGLHGPLPRMGVPDTALTIYPFASAFDHTTSPIPLGTHQHKTIESVLERGEKLDSLVDKSAALSASSKGFYKTAKSQNSCCIIM